MSSSNTPSDPNAGSEHTGGGTPEFLGSAPAAENERPSGNARKWPLFAAAAVGVAAVIGLGGWGAFALLSGGGAQPADAIPDSAVAYASLDLDPSASQKIEAFKMLKKFPGIEKSLHLSSTDDLRRLVFDQMQKDGTCKSLDYDADLKPWIGERLAVAAVPEVQDAPVFALQVGDQDAARKGIDALARCSDADDFGYAFTGDYVILTDSTKHAEAVAADAAEGSLADDATYQKWTGEVGDPGIVTLYAAPGAPAYFAHLSHDMGGDWVGNQQGGSGAAEQLAALSESFKGAAGTVRFDDGTLEAEAASAGASDLTPAAGETAPDVSGLPAGTAAAFSFALPDGWFDTVLGTLAATEGSSKHELLAESEAESGLDLPDDVEALFGHGVSLAVGSDLDLGTLMSSGDLSRLPIGLRVSGDPDQVLPAFEKVKKALGPEADALVAKPGDGVVAIGFNPAYADSLLQDGSLGDDGAFAKAAPDADRAGALMFVNFDAGGGWAEEMAGTLGGLAGDDSSAAANVAPLDALGMSGWTDGDIQRVRFRLTTD